MIQIKAVMKLASKNYLMERPRIMAARQTMKKLKILQELYT